MLHNFVRIIDSIDVVIFLISIMAVYPNLSLIESSKFVTEEKSIFLLIAMLLRRLAIFRDLRETFLATERKLGLMNDFKSAYSQLQWSFGKISNRKFIIKLGAEGLIALKNVRVSLRIRYLLLIQTQKMLLSR